MVITEDKFLEHYGVAGMRWGSRRGSDGPSNRALNKESRKKDWAKQAKQVDAARGKVASGQVKREWKQSKVQFKQDKLTMGSREARRIMNEKRVKLNETYNKSQEVRTQKGQVAAVAALVAIGALQIASAASRA